MFLKIHNSFRDFLRKGNNVRYVFATYTTFLLYRLFDSGIILQMPLDSILFFLVSCGAMLAGLNDVKEEEGKMSFYGGVNVALTKRGAIINGYFFIFVAILFFLLLWGYK